MASAYSQYLAAHGGMAACGEHSGVFVGTDVRATPRGWVFVPMPATVDQVEMAINEAKRGRAAWPPKEAGV